MKIPKVKRESFTATEGDYFNLEPADELYNERAKAENEEYKKKLTNAPKQKDSILKSEIVEDLFVKKSHSEIADVSLQEEVKFEEEKEKTSENEDYFQHSRLETDEKAQEENAKLIQKVSKPQPSQPGIAQSYLIDEFLDKNDRRLKEEMNEAQEDNPKVSPSIVSLSSLQQYQQKLEQKQQ